MGGPRRTPFDAPRDDRPIGARLGPAPLPPPLAQAADTARPLAAGPDPSVTPDETLVLSAIAEEMESSGHRLNSFGAYLAREMEESGERRIALSTKLRELAVVRELCYDRDVAIYKEGFALGSPSSS